MQIKHARVQDITDNIQCAFDKPKALFIYDDKIKVVSAVCERFHKVMRSKDYVLIGIYDATATYAQIKEDIEYVGFEIT